MKLHGKESQVVSQLPLTTSYSWWPDIVQNLNPRYPDQIGCLFGDFRAMAIMMALCSKREPVHRELVHTIHIR